MLINYIINRLRKLTELDIQNNWLFTDQNLLSPPLQLDDKWHKATVNEKKYLVWEKGNKVRWFAQKIIIPQSLDNYPLKNLSLRVALTWWAESAQIFINNQLVCEGDLFDSSSRILVTKKATYNQEFIISLKLISPNHDIGGLMCSRCFYENEYGKIDPSFVADELTVLEKYVANFYPQEEKKIEPILQQLDWSIINNQQEFNNHLTWLRNQLLPFSEHIKKRQFHLLGHAHLDMAWLWTITETYTVAQRTFNSVLNLQKDYPNLKFAHTTAYLYQWIEEHKPLLFKQIQEAVKNNQWEVLGGMWVEPEVNLIAGESLVRQVLYGQKYFLEKFGKYNNVAWLPDSFGFPWQLPQILTLGEIDYFVTGKLHWNDTNKFPHGCFWWQSPDGSRIFTAMSPPNIAGVMNTNPVIMSDYSVEWEKQTGLKDIFWLPGVGDHGGGPTRDMLEVVNRYDDSPFFPKVSFTFAQDYLAKIRGNAPENLPVWDEDLYLELHRGCYTTHGDQKYFNRHGERLLYEAELFSTIVDVLVWQNKIKTHSFASNQDKIEHLWKQVLLNQFHDILPGTSINEVFEEANQLWQGVINDAQDILTQCLGLIALHVSKPSLSLPVEKVVVVFNGLNWQRSEIIEIDVHGNEYNVADCEENFLSTQISADGKLLFLAENVPSVGYREYLLVAKDETVLSPKNLHSQEVLGDSQDDFTLVNQYIRGIIDPNTGNLVSVYDLVNNQEFLGGQGNELQFFADKGQYWDAWNIDPDYEKYPLDKAHLVSIKWLEKGLLRQVIEVKKKYNKSSFVQRYILNFNSPIIHITNRVDWQEEYTLVKVNFPLNFVSPTLNYEVACGVMQQPTQPQTSREKAKWEVCAHQWADLSNDLYGVSLLNDCKYGYDAKTSQIRLSLLRSPKWPDPKCDRVAPFDDRTAPFHDRPYHEFTYSFYPHQNDYQKAKTIQKGYELNTPLKHRIVETKNLLSMLPSQESFINLGADNLILMTFKPTEKKSDQYILRFYESHHQSTNLNLHNSLNLQLATKVNLLENKIEDNQEKINPSSIVSYLCESKKESHP